MQDTVKRFGSYEKKKLVKNVQVWNKKKNFKFSRSLVFATCQQGKYVY